MKTTESTKIFWMIFILLFIFVSISLTSVIVYKTQQITPISNPDTLIIIIKHE